MANKLSRAPSPPSGQPFLRGVVVCSYGKRYTVHVAGRDYDCGVRVNVKRDAGGATAVTTGDDVEITILSDDRGVIERTLPRRTSFSRLSKGIAGRQQVLAANIDQLCIVASAREPHLKPSLIDRFTVSAAIGGLEPLVVINKIDLGRSGLVNDLESAYGQIGIPFCAVSALDPATLSGLRSRLKDRRSLFVGHSGVGKTTLLNSLIPGLNLRTAAVSRVTSKGRHTTTRVELREFPDGGYLVDSPGLKILSHWKVDRSNLPEYFREFAQFRGRCRFDDCLHASEPLCAVKEAVEAGIIPTQRYKSYLQIRETL